GRDRRLRCRSPKTARSLGSRRSPGRGIVDIAIDEGRGGAPLGGNATIPVGPWSPGGWEVAAGVLDRERLPCSSDMTGGRRERPPAHGSSESTRDPAQTGP